MSTSVTTSKNVIRLLGHPVYNEDGAATEAITPGMLTEGVSSIAKNTSTTVGPVAVALEREEMGLGIDDDYAIGDYVKVGVFARGERFLGILASGQDVAEGELLASAGDGTLAPTATPADAIGRSMEAIVTTGATARIRVEVV